jgi:hypothetical protein
LTAAVRIENLSSQGEGIDVKLGLRRHSLPSGIGILTSVLASAGIMLAIPRQWPLWATVVVGLIPFVPLFVVGARWNFRRQHWLVLFYVLVVTQTGHFLEHVAQMVQLHVLGLQGAQAQGVFGMLNIEWVHFLWNTWVVIAAIFLLARYRGNTWLWFTTLFAAFHAVEHFYIVWIYLRTGVAGTPGLLALGGAIQGGLPIARPDLHFLYNLIETVPLAVAFFWQVRHMPTKAGATAPSRRRLSLAPATMSRSGAFFVPVTVMAVMGLAVAASFSGPVTRVLTPDGAAVCTSFYDLVQDVRAQAIPVAEIRSTLDDIERKTPRADFNVQPAIPGFVHAAREAVASFSVYPTFDLMAYSETYEHMDAHGHAQEAIKRLSKACAARGYTATSRAAQTTADRASPPVQVPQAVPTALAPGEVVVRDSTQAVAAVQAYLAKKPWGYFGATCGSWVSMHYRPDQARSAYMPRDNEWVVDIPRDAAALGPPMVRYHIDAHTGLTVGDSANNVDSFFAEGCDKY